MSLLRALFRFLVPSGLLFAGACILLYVTGVPPVLRPYLTLYPWLVATAGLLLGWRFNRSRLVYVVLLLAVGEWTLHFQQNVSIRMFAVSPAALLIPLNLVFIAFWKECGLLNWRNLLRVGWLGGQVAGVWWLFQWDAEQITQWLQQPFLPWSLPGQVQMSQVALAASLLCGALLLVRYLFIPKPMDCGFFWSLPAVVLAFCVPEQMTFWFSTVLLILLVAVVEASFSMAFDDELTGLPARRAMNEHLLKLGRRYVVAMVDIDHFKKVNDTHGHDIGDQVLRMVASCLRRVTGGGRAFRYGGEEFAVIFSGKTVDEATPHLEALRERIAESRFVVRSRKRPRKKPEDLKKRKSTGKVLQVTASIGLAERDDRKPEADQVIKAADQALYRAKKGGRNRVCH